ncbi:MAG: PAS domain-containing protein [Acidobacteria bacterium]|nr:PAS domain-containing protein [Acidobacteriota bacterium]
MDAILAFGESRESQKAGALPVEEGRRKNMLSAGRLKGSTQRLGIFRLGAGDRDEYNTCKNITSQRAEMASTAACGELLGQVENTSDGVFAVGLDQKIICWNRAAEALLGFDSNEVLGRYCYNVIAGRNGNDRCVCRQNCSDCEMAKMRRTDSQLQPFNAEQGARNSVDQREPYPLKNSWTYDCSRIS